MDGLLAFNAAASFVFFTAFVTLDKEKVAGIIDAIHVRIGWFPTLVTFSYGFLRYPFSQALVKHEIFSMKLICQSLFFYLVGVMNNPTFKMKDIFKSFVQHPG